MASALEALDVELNSRTLELLGDTITYTPHGGEPITLLAIVDYEGSSERMAGTLVERGDAAIEVPVSAVTKPDNRDVIDLPKRLGERFQPKVTKLDESGMNWLIVLKTMAA